MSIDCPVTLVYGDVPMADEKLNECVTQAYDIASSQNIGGTCMSGVSMATFVFAVMMPAERSATPLACLSLTGVRSSFYLIECEKSRNYSDQ